MKGIVSRNCGDHVEVSINYCPLCGVELSQYDEEILLAKQRYYEDKLSEIKYHLGRIRTTPTNTPVQEVPLEECKSPKIKF